jgi:CheY-like chemotaxis protein/HPt (histidine-containing phosphotransfer) domain-containing protein
MSTQTPFTSRCSEPDNGLACNKQDICNTEAGFSANLLLAEDNLVNQEVAKMMLEVLGCRVDLADNGIQALDRAMEESYDLILMDCQMPLMDGYEVSRLIRERELAVNSKNDPQRRMAIIAVTGNTTDEDRDRCLSIGMDDFLKKPFTFEELREVLERWLPLRSVAGTVLKNGSAVVSETSPIDRKPLDNIRALQREGAPDILGRVINHYFSQSPEFIRKLNDAVAANEGEIIRSIAHSFKSGSANLGALRLAEICAEMERFGNANTMDVNKEILARIETEYEKVRNALAAVSRGETQ